MPDQRKAPVSNAPSGRIPADLDVTQQPLATPDRTIYMIGNAHLDPVWLWPWQEGYQEARATFWSAIHRMDEYEDFVFTCDQVVLLHWVKEQDPELFEAIRRRVAEGRWVNTGGWWVEPDCNVPMGESFARQGLHGQRFLLDNFGVAATVGMNADPFGHNAMIPSFLRGHGLDTYTFLRPAPHEADLFNTPFWWQAPDGSRVLACRIPHEYCSPPGEVAGQTDKGLGQLDRTQPELMVFYGVGNHGGGPTKANIESIHRYHRMGTYGRMVMASPRDYFDAVLARAPQLPEWREDLQHHASGCYSAHSGIKRWQRRAQWAALNAERWAIMADRLFAETNPGTRYPANALETAWQQILFNQFHDTLPGSAIEHGYDDARDQLGEAISISKRAIVLAHNSIAKHIDIPFEDGTQPVVVFNPHAWPVRTQIELQYGVQPRGVHVVDGDGSLVPHQMVQSVSTTDDRSRGACLFEVELPAFGYRLYRLRPGPAPLGSQWSSAAPGELVATETLLENRHLRVAFDPSTGWLSSLLDKRTGVDLVAGATGPHLQICEDPTDTWGHRVVSYAWPGAEMETRRILVRDAGMARARLRVERSWGRSTMIEEFVLGHDSGALEVHVDLDWREEAHLMKMRFPVALRDPRARFEIPWASIERPVDGAEEPAQSWVDVTGTVDGKPAGLAILNNAKHGYDVSPGDDGTSASIGITAVRSPVYSWHDPRLLDDSAYYVYQDQGRQQFRYLMVPHAGDWTQAGLSRRAAELGQPARAMLESFHDGSLPPQLSFASTSSDHIDISAIKGSLAPDAAGAHELIVRVIETTGIPGETTVELPFVGTRITLDLTAYQHRTFRIPAPGQAEEVDLVELPLDEPGSFGVEEIAVTGISSTGQRDDHASSDARSEAQVSSPGMRRRDA